MEDREEFGSSRRWTGGPDATRTSYDPAVTNRKRRLRIVVASTVVASVLAVLALAAVVVHVSVPTLAPASELDRVVLSGLAPSPRSDVLQRVLEASPAGTGPTEPFDVASQQIEWEQWIEDPAAVLSAAEARADEARAFLSAIQEVGCLEPDPAPGVMSPTDPPVLPFFDHVLAIAVSTVVRVQSGDAARAAAEVVMLLDGLARLQTACTGSLTTTTTLQRSTDWALRAAGFVLADPALSAEAQDAVARRVVAAETAPWRIADACRREWASTERMLAVLAPGSEARDLRDMRDAMRRTHARLVWLANEPPRSGVLARPTVEETYAQALRAWPEELAMLRLGRGTYLGVMMGETTISVARMRMADYLSTRCEWAIRRARWIAAYRERDRAVPPSLARPEPANPLSGAIITADDPATLHCEVDPAAPAGVWDGLPTLPPPPPRADAAP